MAERQVDDVIERELLLAASRSAVWAALTTPEGLAGWWWDSAELDLRPGGAISFVYEGTVYPATVEELDPERRFVLTWRPFQQDEAAAPDLTTRLEFVLDDHAEGTRLRLRESGFAALPGALAAQTFEANLQGWDEEVLPRLRAFVTGGAPAEAS